jgi:hypothetical protein
MSDDQNKGPIYGVVLYDEMPIANDGWKQAFPDRDELEKVRKKVGDRTVAAFEVLTEHHRALTKAIERSGYDLSVCMDCGAPVVCIPDGMPSCEPCAVKAHGPRMQYCPVTHEDIGKQIEVTAGSITDPDCEWVIRTLVSIEEIDKFSRRYVCLLEDGLQSYEHYEEARIKVPK